MLCSRPVVSDFKRGSLDKSLRVTNWETASHFIFVFIVVRISRRQYAS